MTALQATLEETRTQLAAALKNTPRNKVRLKHSANHQDAPSEDGTPRERATGSEQPSPVSDCSLVGLESTNPSILTRLPPPALAQAYAPVGGAPPSPTSSEIPLAGALPPATRSPPVLSVVNSPSPSSALTPPEPDATLFALPPPRVQLKFLSVPSAADSGRSLPLPPSYACSLNPTILASGAHPAATRSPIAVRNALAPPTAHAIAQVQALPTPSSSPPPPPLLCPVDSGALSTSNSAMGDVDEIRSNNPHFTRFA